MGFSPSVRPGSWVCMNCRELHRYVTWPPCSLHCFLVADTPLQSPVQLEASRLLSIGALVQDKHRIPSVWPVGPFIGQMDLFQRSGLYWSVGSSALWDRLTLFNCCIWVVLHLEKNCKNVMIFFFAKEMLRLFFSLKLSNFITQNVIFRKNGVFTLFPTLVVCSWTF